MTQIRIKKGDSKICHLFEFATSQEAWEKINEYFLIKPQSVFDEGSVFNKGVSVVYNVFFTIRKAWVDPEFDYNRMFAYTPSKWTLLINNYLDLNQLDLLRSKVRYFQTKYNQNYNLSYSFDNTHGNGKGCLLSATFSRRIGDKTPNITVNLRSSEITKRLIFDFLLVQRMGEYIYGPNTSFTMSVFATQMYCNTETVLMYHAYKDVMPFIEQSPNKEWIKDAKEAFNKFFDKPETFGTYKVFLRSARVINPKAFNFKFKPLLAKDLQIYEGNYLDIEFPDGCITLKQRRKFLKQLEEKKKKDLKDRG